MADIRDLFAGGGGGQPTPAAQQSGIPQEVIPSGAPGEEVLSEALKMLRSGQIGAERFLELLSLLAGSVLGGDDGNQPQPQPQLSAEPSIQELFGGQV